MADETTAPKAGWKTSEFWLTTIAALLSLAYASGIVGDGSNADKICGFIAAALTSIGYTVSRTLVKR